MRNKKKILLLISLIILTSCGGAKDALIGKKRSDTSDEFLIKKKNPLILPPDYEKMPVPVGEDTEILEDQGNSKIKELVTDTQTKSENNNLENSNLEKSILERINN